LLTLANQVNSTVVSLRLQICIEAVKERYSQATLKFVSERVNQSILTDYHSKKLQVPCLGSAVRQLLAAHTMVVVRRGLVCLGVAAYYEVLLCFVFSCARIALRVDSKLKLELVIHGCSLIC
jgi:hypothetical protein